jgi:hypothetical protein
MYRQYSDLAEDERAFVLEKFCQVTTRWSQISHAGAGNEDDVGKDDRSHLIIVTDACLPLLTSGESPLNAHLLINYELPAKKVLLILLFSVIHISHLPRDFLCSHVSLCIISWLFSIIFTFLNLHHIVTHCGYLLWCHLLLGWKILCRLINYINCIVQLGFCDESFFSLDKLM